MRDIPPTVSEEQLLRVQVTITDSLKYSDILYYRLSQIQRYIVLHTLSNTAIYCITHSLKYIDISIYCITDSLKYSDILYYRLSQIQRYIVLPTLSNTAIYCITDSLKCSDVLSTLPNTAIYCSTESLISLMLIIYIYHSSILFHYIIIVPNHGRTNP